MKFHDVRVRTLLIVAHIHCLAINLIFVNKIVDANVDFNLNKIGSKLVYVSMVLV